MVAVVLDALAGRRDPELRTRLGPELDDHVRRLLRDHALAWARAAGGGAPPLEARGVDQLPELVGGHAGPVLLVAPDVPGLSPTHLDAALDDVANGVLVATAPTSDGTPFLVVLARPEPALLRVVGAPFEELAATALELGGGLGMLRADRRLATVADARALRADPTAPPELRAALATLD
ncbi:MAG TPA: hypothetical protein VFT50_07965 [Baekduia sp.]|nr:hypothetical protein [Baekduia sp.]